MALSSIMIALFRDAGNKRFPFLLVVSVLVLLATPALALDLDLNSFRAQHKLPPLSVSGMLSAAAAGHASDMAARRHLDHNGFRARVPISGGASAENVLWGCDSEDCAIRMWAKSGGHRANMLKRDVSAYGIASAVAGNGKRYWVLELGN
jgi:uncharacterized protein YkwD